MASGGVKTKLDTREFTRAMRQLSKTTSKDLAFYFNDQMRRLAWEALKKTPKADKAKIDRDLGVKIIDNGVISRGKNKGKRKTKRDFQSDDTLAHRLVNARRRKKGEEMIWGRELDAAAKKMIASRKKGIGYMKSGWLPAIKKFSAATGKSFGKGGVRQFGTPNGSAKIAKAKTTFRISAELVNTAVKRMTKNSWSPGHAFEIAKGVIRRAMASRVTEMRSTLNKRMQKTFNRTNARV